MLVAPCLFYIYLLILRTVNYTTMPAAVASLISIESPLLTLSMMSGNTIRPEAQINLMLLRPPIAICRVRGTRITLTCEVGCNTRVPAGSKQMEDVGVLENSIYTLSLSYTDIR